MSLEQAVNRLADNVELLAKVFMATAQQVQGADAPAVETAPAPKPAPEKSTAPAAKAAPAPKAPKAAKAAEAPAPAAAAPVEGAPDFDRVSEITRELGAVRGRDAVVNLLTEFGAAKAGNLKQEQYAEYVDRATKLINGDAEDDLAS